MSVYANTKKVFMLVYDLSEFQDWQLKRIPLMCDTRWYRNVEEGTLEIDVYERNINSRVKAIYSHWNITPMAIVRMEKKNPVLYPIPKVN